MKTSGRLKARYHRLVLRFGGYHNPSAKKKAIVAIAHTLLKIAYSFEQLTKARQKPMYLPTIPLGV